jgi:hypothetical protein
MRSQGFERGLCLRKLDARFEPADGEHAVASRFLVAVLLDRFRHHYQG